MLLMGLPGCVPIVAADQDPQFVTVVAADPTPAAVADLGSRIKANPLA